MIFIRNIEDIKQIMVVGAGTMGHSIAQVYAQAEFDVYLVDIKQELLNHALERIDSNLRLLLKYKRINEESIEKTLKHLKTSTDLESCAKTADLVVEAVNEDKEIKRIVYNDLNKYCSTSTIFASNTSNLNIFRIVKIENPERLIIHHWFRPAYIAPLVEVVSGKKTSQDVINLSLDLMRKLGKKPIHIKKYTPGFIVNKIQMAINSAVFTLLLQNIANPQEIDVAVKTTLGIRLPIVGVVQNLDFVGLDVISDFLKNMGLELSIIKECTEKGFLGIKTSQGIFDYGKRSEHVILKQHDEICLKNLEYFEKNIGFDVL